MCILRGQVGVWEGEWVQVSNYNVCISRRCWDGGSALSTVERWVGDCGGGMESTSIFFLLA